MPTRRCSLCSINYPSVLRFEECPVCGETTRFMPNEPESEYWLDEAQGKAEQYDGDVENLIDWLDTRDG